MNIQFELKDIIEIFDSFGCEYTESGNYFVGYFLKPVSNLSVFIVKKIVTYYDYTIEIDVYSDDEYSEELRLITNIPYEMMIN